MKLCRFKDSNDKIHAGLVLSDGVVADLTAAGIEEVTALLESGDLLKQLADLSRAKLPRLELSSVHLLAPVDRQEVWAAGVTYLRSKAARMEESDFSASAYDRVYVADRPELFFKSLPEKVVAPGASVGIRKDARWNVPEPELVLVANSLGKVVGYSLGNDMSSRDIEGENVLYLPQAKIYDRSCAIGPFIVVGVSEAEVRTWEIRLQIERGGQTVFTGRTSVGLIKRSFDELAGYLFRSQNFPHGAFLLTGTGIVPPESFTLEEGDWVRMEISEVGLLANPVVRV
jgi:2-dehydro-3-deoxy-D-arabinonate dehydratase